MTMVVKKLAKISPAISLCTLSLFSTSFLAGFSTNTFSASWTSGQCPGGNIQCPSGGGSAHAACSNLILPEHIEHYQTVISQKLTGAGVNPGYRVAQCYLRDINTGQRVLSAFTPTYITGDFENCSPGYQYDDNNYGCIRKQPTRKSCSVGNPILFHSGDKFQRFEDYSATSFATTYSIERFYLSNLQQTIDDSYEDAYGNLASSWSFGFSDRLTFLEYRLNGTTVTNYRASIRSDDGSEYNFISTDNTTWTPVGTSNLSSTFENIVDGNQQVIGWKVYFQNQTVQHFNIDGYLTEEYKAQQANSKFTLSYDKSSPSLSSWDRIALHHNNILLFTYWINHLEHGYKVTKAVTSDNLSIDYQYDTYNNIISGTFYDQTTEQYHYEDTNFNKALTGITDRRGNRYVTWTYDSEGRTTASFNANNTNRYSIDYSNINDAVDPHTIVTNPLGKVSSYHYSADNQRNLLRVEGQASANCAAANQAYTYDANGFMASKTDWKGNTTTYINNDRGLEISRTEASGTPQARTITTEWHPTFNLRTKVTEPERETTFAYDSHGRLTSQEVTAR